MADARAKTFSEIILLSVFCSIQITNTRAITESLSLMLQTIWHVMTKKFSSHNNNINHLGMFLRKKYEIASSWHKCLSPFVISLRAAATWWKINDVIPLTIFFKTLFQAKYYLISISNSRKIGACNPLVSFSNDRVLWYLIPSKIKGNDFLE